MPLHLKCDACNNVGFCSAACKSNGLPFHQAKCNNPNKDDNTMTMKTQSAIPQPTQQTISAPSYGASAVRNPGFSTWKPKANNDFIKGGGKKGTVGLQNIGNTCYMNSALQCLSHSDDLTKYFLDGLYKEEINKENPIGSGGKLAN